MSPEELVFARKASGLVRGLSVFDAFAIALMFTSSLFCIWFGLEVGRSLFPAANLVISTGLVLVFLGIPSVLVWGILSGSMPRSGGEYVYNSRILHPMIAMAASFAMVVAQFFWQIWEGTWLANPALSSLSQYMGWPGLTTFVNSKAGMALSACVAWFVVCVIVILGMKVFKAVQRPIVWITLVLTVIFIIVIAITSRAAFIGHWNTAAAHYHSLTYNQFVPAVAKARGAALPKTWNWSDTFGSIGVMYTFVIFSYAMAYVGGEIKRPDKSLMKANALAAAVPALLGIAAYTALQRTLPFDFVSAAAWNDYSGGVKGYHLPYSTSFMDLTFIASGMNKIVGIMMCLSWLLFTIALLCVILVLVQRVFFAWGMDRMGPKWFTDISPRFGSPVKMYVIIAGVSALLSVVYVMWLASALTGLIAGGMYVVSVFLTASLSAILLPFRKRARSIWDQSPYRRYAIGGVPLVSVAGGVYLVVVCLIMYFGFFDPRTRDVTGKNVVVFIAAWVGGSCWYVFWRWYARRKAGVDMAAMTALLPPE